MIGNSYYYAIQKIKIKINVRGYVFSDVLVFLELE